MSPMLSVCCALCGTGIVWRHASSSMSASDVSSSQSLQLSMNCRFCDGVVISCTVCHSTVFFTISNAWRTRESDSRLLRWKDDPGQSVMAGRRFHPASPVPRRRRRAELIFFFRRPALDAIAVPNDGERCITKKEFGQWRVPRHPPRPFAARGFLQTTVPRQSMLSRMLTSVRQRKNVRSMHYLASPLCSPITYHRTDSVRGQRVTTKCSRRKLTGRTDNCSQ